jgi:hypothetical protein
MTMKYIMTEAQIVTAVKKFDKSKFVKGRFSDVIEEMTLDYLEGKKVCDVAVLYASDMYMVIVLTSGWVNYDLDTKIMKHIKSYLGIVPMVVIHENEECDPIEN